MTGTGTGTGTGAGTPAARVFLVDDHAMTRAGMRSLIGGLGGFDVVGDCGDARAAIESVAELRPDLVMLDISMPGLSGIDAMCLKRVHTQQSG